MPLIKNSSPGSKLMKKYLILLFVLAFCKAACADTIVLKSGEIVNGKIIERTDKYIKINSGIGVALTYYLYEIATIDGQKHPFQSKLKAAKPRGPQHAIKSPSSGSIDPDQIHKVLKHLGYFDKACPVIEKQIIALLSKINFPKLKKEALQVRSDPEKLKSFIAKLSDLLKEEGYIDRETPHPLIKLLTSSLVSDDVSEMIFSSPISFGQKVDLKKALAACTAISQLGSIVLKLLDIDVKVGFSPAHVFNCVPLDGRQYLFVDFSNQVFEIVDINQYYYSLATRTRLLKDQYHITPARLLEINAQLVSELRTDSLQELLCYLYRYIYISDDYATTPAIFINIGNIYLNKAKYDQAISVFNKVIDKEPQYAEAYRGLGIVYNNKGDLDQAIVEFNKAIELFPDFAEALHDRGRIFNSQEEEDKAISDFSQALIIDPNYIEAYRDRGGLYSKQGKIDQALSDYNKAIEIDPYYSEAYQSRAEAYFAKQEYDKSWEDVHKVESFGDEMNSDFLEKLKNASMLRKFFLPALIIAPILILFIIRLF